MLYKLLAEAVIILHFAFIMFAILGGLLILWRNWVIYIHLPAVVWGAVVEIKGWVCPLTPLENQLMRLSGDSGYANGFIDHYLLPIIYPAGITHQIQVILGILVILINTGIYAFVYWRKSRPNHPIPKGNKL